MAIVQHIRERQFTFTAATSGSTAASYWMGPSTARSGRLSLTSSAARFTCRVPVDRSTLNPLQAGVAWTMPHPYLKKFVCGCRQTCSDGLAQAVKNVTIATTAVSVVQDL